MEVSAQALGRSASVASSDPQPEAPVYGPVLKAITEHIFHEPQGQETWQKLPELPAGSEILATHIPAESLPHNRIDTAWPSKNDYLETHYRLLRHEGTEALRLAVNKYKSNITIDDDEDLCIYTKVHILGYLMSRLGPLCKISFSTEHAQKKILWQQSRRLVPGSVVAISTKRDNFRTICMTATVAKRPYRDGLDQDPPQIDLFWGSVDQYVIDPDMELIMVEARTGYFEAVRHTLVGLQMAANSDSPLFKYVVDGDRSDDLASFIKENPVIDLSACLPATASRHVIEKLKRYDARNDMPNIEGMTSLDETQFHALYRMVTKELCVVQGPPGTGKTFTSVEALKIILANQKKTDPPIIVAAQTNHALDQLLTLCLDAGAHILRVGGRTESERIEEHTMYNARQKFGGSEPAFRALDARRRQLCTELMDLASSVFNDGLLQPEDLLRVGVLTQQQYDSMVEEEMEHTEFHRPHGPFSLWLAGECVETAVLRNKHCDNKLAGDDDKFNREEYEYEDDFENIADDDEDKDRIHGTFINFTYKWTGKEPAHLTSWYKRAVREMNKSDLYAVPKNMRGAVYQLMFERYIEKLRPGFLSRFAEYIQCCKEVKTHRWRRDVRVVQQVQANIVGCTTTGLTKYRGFLAALGAKTMLVEEAAETRESNITSALYPSIQQLILVGDHMQLAPFCDNRWLGEAPYYLSMSLFERMVVYTGIPYIMLDKQRRMAPEIRAVMDHFYDGLVDHPVALERKPVPGMGDKRTWLFSHTWEDAKDANHSRYNIEEAAMIVNFFVYLINNGIKQSQITILTFYKAQRRHLLKQLKLHPSLPVTAEPYQVHTVDSYQGEENDIVLLSLVRSPPLDREFAVGFLDNKNRVIVAISRARRGFYVFGNILNASRASAQSADIWDPIWSAFEVQKRIDPKRGLPLECQQHGKTIWIKNTDGWKDNTGGCDERCDYVRECGHKCTFPCHNKPHDQIRCGQICGKRLACGHNCQIWCKDPCNCVCPTFQAMKTQNETRQLQDHQQMHMDLEELLQAEAARDEKPQQANGHSPVDMQMVLARADPSPMYATVAKPRDVVRLVVQEPPKPGPFKGKTGPTRGMADGKLANRVRQATQKRAQQPSVPAGPILRPPPQRLQVAPKPGAAGNKYQNFVRNIDTHDKANVKARREFLATTAGQEPSIRDTYRPVALDVNGQRTKTPATTPEKDSDRVHEGLAVHDGLAKASEILILGKSGPTDTLIPELVLNGDADVFADDTPARSGDNPPVATAAPLEAVHNGLNPASAIIIPGKSGLTDSLIPELVLNGDAAVFINDTPTKKRITNGVTLSSTLSALAVNDDAAASSNLPAHSSPREHRNGRSRSTNSAANKSADESNGLPYKVPSSHATTVDGTPNKKHGTSLHDLALLFGAPTIWPQRLKTIQEEVPAVPKAQWADLNSWLDSLPSVNDQPLQVVQQNGASSTEGRVLGQNGGGKKEVEEEDLLIIL